MIAHEHRLSVSRQAKLLGISRGSVYYQRRPHASLGRQTPDQAYVNQPKPTQAAA